MTPLAGTRRNVLCPDELTVTSQLTDSAATVTTEANQMSYMATPASLSNQNDCNTTVASSANEKKYSVYTQYQLDELDAELSRFENHQEEDRRFKQHVEVTPSERPFFPSLLPRVSVAIVLSSREKSLGNLQLESWR